MGRGQLKGTIDSVCNVGDVGLGKGDLGRFSHKTAERPTWVFMGCSRNIMHWLVGPAAWKHATN